MKAYVIERMYAGSYISDKLGGEAINLLHDDHKNNYIFVGPYGFIDKKYDDKVEGVILTRLVKEGCFEVLGFAKIGKGGQVSYQKGYKLEDRFRNAKVVLDKFADDNDIRYGGVTLKEIHNGAFAGADITFKSDYLLLPKNEIYITDSHHSDFEEEGITVRNLSDKRFPNQSLHCYITDEENPEAFKAIEELSRDKFLWEKDRINKVDEGRIIDQHFNLIEVIRKEYDELVYSNFFSYVFKEYPDVFRDFSNKVLGVKLSGPYSVEREKENIDLWIEGDSEIIVIENKIKSGINGISPRHDFSEDGLVQSQLLKYYKYAESEKGEKNASYFIFVPDYNKVDLAKYSGSKNYKVINYSTIYEFFRKKSIEDAYYREFVNALYRHTKDRAVDYAEDMAIRFLNQIRRGKK